MSNYPTNWTSNAIQTIPSLSDLKSSGYPTNGDPAKGIPPTLPGAAWFHWVTQTLASAIAGNGLTIDQTDTDQLLQAMLALGKSVVPIGAMFHWPGKTIPKGYLLCNGASLLRSEYPELFSVIGTANGSVDSAHFNIPSLHHKFLEATTVLSEVCTYVAAGLPNTSGDFPHNYIGTYSGATEEDRYSGGLRTVLIDTTPLYPTGTANHAYYHLSMDMSKSNSVYGASNTVQPSAMRSLVLVRAF